MLYPQVSSKVYHDSFCQLDSSVSLPWVIYFEAFFYMFYPGKLEIPSLNMTVHRLKVATLPLDLPCSGPGTPSGEVLATGMSHGKEPDRSSLSGIDFMAAEKVVSSGMEEMPSLNMPVQRLKVATLPLDLPCSGPVTHSGEILTTGKSHGKKPDRFSLTFTHHASYI
jgi:hypothetical protein